MTAYGPWENIDPGAGAAALQRGISTGAGIVSDDFARHQRQQEINMERERLTREEQQMQVNQEIAKQQQSMATIATARRYQAQQGYQSDISAGMTPAQAFVKWGPLLTPSLAGFGADISQMMRSGPTAFGAPSMAPSQIPGTAPRNYAPPAAAPSAQPITDENGNVIAHSFGNRIINMPRTNAKAPDWSTIDKEQWDRLTKRADAIDTALRKGGLSQKSEGDMTRERDQLQKQADAIAAKYASSPAATPPPEPGASDVTYPAPPRVRAADPQATSAAPPAVNPNLRPPTPNSWMPPQGTTASGVKYRLVTPGVSQPPVIPGASAPAPDRMLHPMMPRAQAPAAQAPQTGFSQSQVEAQDRELSWNNDRIAQLKSQIDNEPQDPQGRAADKKELAAIQKRQDWLETTPRKGEEPPPVMGFWNRF